MHRTLHYLTLLSLLIFSGLVNAIDDKSSMERLFSPYAELLEKFLKEKKLPNDGLVSAFDYQAALNHPDTKQHLKEQQVLLAEFDIALLNKREKALAFWNNAYNYFMIEKILTDLDNGKLVSSVWDYGGRYNPFRDNVFERDLFNIGGKKYSLNTMEKGILLGDEYQAKGWKEARVHFSVNCASVGCPPLRAEIYTAENIDAMLSENTRRAFNTPSHLNVEGDTLYLTELFKWYETDYVEEAGSVVEFIQSHADDHVIEKMSGVQRIHYIDYDWRLNKPGNFDEF